MTIPTTQTRRSPAWLYAIVICFSLGVGGYLGWFTAKRQAQEAIAGEKNYASLVILKALTQLREDQSEEAVLTLEIALDLNIKDIWERSPTSEKTANILSRIRGYRMQYPSFTETVQTKDRVLRERHRKAHEILGISSSGD